MFTAAPLSVFRRNGVVVTLVNVPSPSIIAAATGTGVSTLSGGEALAADLAASNVYVKSHQDPSGTDQQFAQIFQNRQFRILGDLPSLRDSDGSGIAVSPGSGGGTPNLIVADEAGNRIASIGLVIPLVCSPCVTSSTLFAIPWTMNPNGNGTGHQQYAPILTAFGTGPTHLLLYFWDSTQSALYSVDALAPTTFTPLLALEQNVPAGQHVATVGNHIVYDFNTATLLLTDGSTNTVIEVNPANSPVTTSTLFSNLPGTPTSIALKADTNQVFVQIGNSIYVGPRSGGSLSLFATGFTLLTDIVIGNATLGSGSSLFAVDKQLNTVYEMPLAIAISSVNLSSTTLTIGGSSVPYTAILSNGSGTTVSSVFVQAYIDQGTASRGAGGSLVTCAQTLGDLPPGSCNFNLSVSASNSPAAGTGTLVPGPATARFELRSPSTLFSVFTVTVTLQ